MGDFESGLNGIKCDASALELPFIRPVDKLVNTITDIKEDNFFHSDSTTLTEVSEKLSEINAAITKDTYFYLSVCGGEKQVELKELLELLEELKAKKLALEPSIIGNDATKYNDNVEAAKLCYLSDLEVGELEKYKKNPHPLTYQMWGRDEKYNTVYEDVIVGVINGNKFTKKEYTLKKIKYDSHILNTIKDDKFSIPLKYNGRKVTKAEISIAKDHYKKAHDILTGRGFNTNIKMDSKRPGNTSYSA